jgi:hypothetical protein
MISYFVRYRSSAADPAVFVEYYATRHAAIPKQFAGIRTLSLYEPTVWNDPFPVRPDGTALLAQMTFDISADLERTLHFEARRRAREDFGRFPPFSGDASSHERQDRLLMKFQGRLLMPCRLRPDRCM